ncbi:transcriptional regulator with XRE-family HTH domain [Aequitasia blattaphilus]|uniref:Helix-turn-helix domain-containing protein n=1 Tax=Aequitasia blattaphilus TaxID=2949332 RepID=A0ABT1E843_9FIRM|nr:helix-turn-helix transcriptional regulator [Aequitasia blattaphilus]MCP1101997.1 helix-turn-helix domain-containing protein [Aequitasia blattaphilus]MCR8614637.1 helix-turn-helix domain-containing protein [Aequitasia blattaphilus]
MEKTIGKAIEKIRESKELDEAGFGRLIFLEKEDVVKIENGEAKPSIETLQMISNIFSVSINDLREGEIKAIPSREDLMKTVLEVKDEVAIIKENNQYLLGILRKAGLESLLKRHIVQEKQVHDKEVYVIVDTQTGEVVQNIDFEDVTWDNRAVAQSCADNLNRAKEVLPEASKPSRNSVHKDSVVSIGNRRVK